MLEKNKDFLDFVIKVVNIKRNEWKKEYGNEFDLNLNKYVNIYTQSKIF